MSYVSFLHTAFLDVDVQVTASAQPCVSCMIRSLYKQACRTIIGGQLFTDWALKGDPDHQPWNGIARGRSGCIFRLWRIRTVLITALEMSVYTHKEVYSSVTKMEGRYLLNKNIMHNL